MLIIKAFRAAVAQLDDPAFRRVILLGLGLSIVVFAAILIGLIALIPLIPESGIGWIDTAVGWISSLSVPFVFLLVLWLLFPAVMSTFISFFLDDIIDAVEDIHYPQAAGWRQSPIYEAVWLAAKLSVLIILANLIAVPLYLILLFSAVGSFLLYLLINGYLMGREYYEMVAIRHGTPSDAKRLYKQNSGTAMQGGLAIALLFMVPIANLLAPVIGIAMMVHLFHARRTENP